MKNILILDTETSGTGADASCIEVACVLYSLAHAAPMQSFASLIRAGANPAERVHRIPVALLGDAPAESYVWNEVRCLAARADAVLAHNAEFDKRFVPDLQLPWICSMDDLSWPAQSDGKSLVSIALAHGLGVAHAHRALSDCDLLSRLLTRVAEMGTDLHGLIAHGLRPKAFFQALVPYERRDLAKQAGFHWDVTAKRWTRRLAVEDAAALPFRVRRLDAEEAA